MRPIAIAFFLLLTLHSYTQDRNWVMFTDKGDISAYPVSDILSHAALVNRAKQGIGIDSKDFPVNQQYLTRIAETGAVIHHITRWFNGVSVTASPEGLEEIRQLPFVKSVRPVAQLIKAAPSLAIDCDTFEYKGTPLRQLGMLGIDDLHGEGYTGTGVKVAVFDNGYYRVDSLDAFSHLFDEGRILGQWDFVDEETNTFDSCIHCKHGTYVFSILAAIHPGGMYGSAPGAEYFLFRTEDDYAETQAEEDNWIAAAELADSLGAQIFTTSLGYKDFDGGIGDYSDEDMDGNTALITKAGDVAASRGILVVNSAGNNGNRGINAPADGDSILAVGAVDECEEIAPFSSRGPTTDGRIKPDIVAMGELDYFIDPSGEIKVGNGTSFSCPLISGMAACLMQKHPELTAWEVHSTLIQSADRFNNPDNIYGYGLPQASRFETLVATTSLPNHQYKDFRSGELLVYPNPASETIRIAWISPVSPASYRVELTDSSGRLINLKAEAFSEAEWQLSLPVDLAAGVYIIRLLHNEYPDVVYQRKVAIQ